ncbi:hypothetical protein O6H91_08G063700 [Diphasiastrum complanatum]|uniref:Uncharacterized protein n=1 Tax=Diphasiastrum complanatum TaxID=34168 RepID=A0ACC2CYJ0_DIPCM|nr:hypothetical protein O6H91_08G063700 [Diphasiastrum complanatum]
MAHMLINCTNCNTPLQLPPGATVIRCVVCHAFTHVADSRAPLRSVTYPPTSALTPFLYSNGGQHYGPHPGPNPLQYSPAPSHPYGSKKAVICGISYRYSRHELKGCLNDAKCMKYFLTTKFDFPESAILMLTEEEADPLKLPTKHNMRMALYWLVKDCRAGDSLVFHFSGHGSQQVNLNGEELDGFDETLCPLDFETQGMLVDDEINATIVRPLPPGVRLHAIVDACHSGTVLDLPFVCKFNR